MPLQPLIISSYAGIKKNRAVPVPGVIPMELIKSEENILREMLTGTFFSYNFYHFTKKV